MHKPMRIYVDTSVFGGTFDNEFERASTAFFEQVRRGYINAVVSALVSREIENAPASVVSLFQELEPLLEPVGFSEDAYELQQAYVEAQVIGPKWEADALHVALATVHHCRAIVSWNFKHIVNLKRIPLYNGVNLVRGYGAIAIHTPPEVLVDEEDDEGF